VWVLASIRISVLEVLVVHANALLTPRGRLELAQCVVDDGWPLRRAAERFQVSVPTAQRWAKRYRERDLSRPAIEAMADRSSRPKHSPAQTRRPMVRKILHLRRKRGWGPARIADKLGLRSSTVNRVLRREGEPLLHELDLATRRELRRQVKRYERDKPGELVHVDVKKLGKVPPGGGHRVHGRSIGKQHASLARRARKHAGQASGYHFLHTALDDHSRLAYTEVLADEQATTAAAFWRRAVIWFASHGVTVERVLTDNGSCYRSRLWTAACHDLDVTHKRTKPYRPQTNGKVERFHRTLAVEWAYVRAYSSETARVAALRKWLHLYNHHRTHTALGGKPPASRVTNLSGQYN
jgi:transposase InsO family protein